MSMNEELPLGAQKKKKILQKLSRNKSYLDELQLIRSKYKIPENGFQFEGSDEEISYNQRKQLHRFDIKKEFQEDLEKFIKKFENEGLNYSFKNTVMELIVLGIARVSIHNFGIHRNWFRVPEKYGSGEFTEGKFKKLQIEIYGNTTLQDIKNGWDEIEEYKKELPDYDPKKFRPFFNNERDRRITELFNQNMSIEEITDIINEEFSDEIIGYDYLYKIRDRYLKNKH